MQTHESPAAATGCATDLAPAAALRPEHFQVKRISVHRPGTLQRNRMEQIRVSRRRGSACSRLGTIAALLVATLGVAACSDQRTSESLRTGSINMNDYKQRHPIILAEGTETLDVPVGMASSKLSDRLAHSVTVFAAQSRLQGAPGITILVPDGSPNAATASRMAREVAAAVERGGVSRRVIVRQSYETSDADENAPIRVAYTRMKAMVPHRCGVWPDQIGVGNNANVDDYNFGCATQSNIAAMVAHPSDLVTPAGEDPADATRRTAIIDSYRKGEATQSKTTINVISTTGSN